MVITLARDVSAVGVAWRGVACRAPNGQELPPLADAVLDVAGEEAMGGGFSLWHASRREPGQRRRRPWDR
jgi:hypothetical protein